MSIPRRLWFDLHSWVGLKLCVFMSFICLTGTLAVLAHEIDWLLTPEMRVTPTAKPASWGTQLEAARRTYPGWKLDRMNAGEGSRFATQFPAKTPEGRLRHVWTDPYTGTVTGDTGWFNVHRFLRNTHRHLMMPVKYGVPIVCSLAIVLLISLATSFFIYKKWWRGFFKWPRGERSRRFWGDVHRLAGVWSLWFVLLIALTGVWYLVEELGLDAPSVEWTEVAKPAKANEKVIDGAAVDRAAASAARDWPGLEIRGVALDAKRGIITLEGEANAVLVRERVNALRYDTRGVLLQRVAGTDLGIHQRISEMADPLHFGNFAGLPVKLLWFVAGALLTTLSITGSYLYGLRVLASIKAPKPCEGKARERGIPPSLRASLAWQRAWHAMSYWRWLWVVLAFVWLWSMPQEISK